MDKPNSSNTLLLLGGIMGYLAGDQLVNFQKLPNWVAYLGTIIDALATSGVIVVLLFPERILTYKFWLGKLGVWLVGLIIGGWLPLVKGVVDSMDFWTIVVLLPMHAVILYTLYRIQRWFDIPRPQTSVTKLPVM